MRVQDRSPLCLVTMTTGGAWVIPEGDDPVRLTAGDIALLRGPDPYLVADDPATPPHVVIHPGQRCTTPDGRDISQALDLGVRTWGTSMLGPHTMLVGAYERRGAVSQRLLTALPPLLVVPGDAIASPLIGLLGEEITKEEPGQEVVLDRLLDLLVITVVRVWFARPEADAPAWYRSYSDPVVGRALRMLHNNPAHPWTVAGLAAEVGVSRAALARRFSELVGEPPMSYLTDWRLALAADLLREPDVTVGAVARQVGYGSPYALSTAFKRIRGVSPQEHRAAAAT